jgi:hypothetical protein
MSNQVGDRYACSDPSCGCVVEVKQSCAAEQDDSNVRRDFSDDAPTDAIRATGATDPMNEGDGEGTGRKDTESMGHSIGGGESAGNRGFRTEGLATSSTSGPQGATGEGVFGTVAGGDSGMTHTEGRYGSRLPRKTRTAGDASQLGGSSEGEPSRGLSGSPTCFCGSKMKEVGEGSGVGKTFAAGV